MSRSRISSILSTLRSVTMAGVSLTSPGLGGRDDMREVAKGKERTAERFENEESVGVKGEESAGKRKSVGSR